MGHDILKCDNCNSNVMEGRNEWECDNCGSICNQLTSFIWKSKEEYEIIYKKHNKKQKKLNKQIIHQISKSLSKFDLNNVSVKYYKKNKGFYDASLKIKDKKTFKSLFKKLKKKTDFKLFSDFHEIKNTYNIHIKVK